ncbi:DNA polymerase III subunit gamma/tau [Gluconobacter oxydans]|uniref:DNA polymerase III subunit gamma/tau n=2 Tax=Gluconobacter oxydans TaxID=442 RepID=Q5FTB4_GLUOX|nr:DNA polymerase III subunit gamma/tau [Gluconobacter oxydans]AAW60382.1 DNA polymerase III subunit gamma/tau [Gluconobacter oxydans 621H]MBF0855236.1 DNA polymerase III subunit gamma/tau [Gluconobacter oxydans]TCW28749.1 DNA polymerase-3 subunit gamma/tau [Gluconobacter oxydans]GEC59729.1 DNA polymerase III subunit gamma/tau [Gluconobacter oxydans]
MTDENDDLPLPPENGGGFFGDAPEPEMSALPAAEATPYRVLARKYRPQTFDDLIGQDSLVRILRRAFELKRVAHAFMLTGVRGVGKTTTARIIARALNCVGPDGKGGPTADPCGVCPNCTAILADRHPDVLEMDAASRTGVDDVREIIEATRFRPMQARMKVFIIDEVHMLSRNAFNALLKTLEEPPPQVTFIFATTELRKVPVTVLSRCQRFDLRRVPQSLLAGHFHNIAVKEGATLSEDALALIARAADGSVRDGLSLLDQAIAQGASDADAVADMLGLADRGLVFDLLDALMAGKPADALDLTDQAYARGADLGVLLADLLDLLHLISRLKAIPSLREGRDLPEAERTRGAALADRLSNAVLGRAWQILLKGVQEVETAPDRRQAAEMVLIRLCHASLLPTPDRLIRQLTEGGQDLSLPTGPSGPTGGASSAAPSGAVSGIASSSVSETSGGPGPRAHVRLVANGGEIVEPGIGYAEAAPEPEPEPELPPAPRTWREMVAMVAREREPVLHGLLRNAVHLVRFSPPDVQIRAEEPQARIERQLQKLLDRVYPGQWRVSASTAPGEPTLDEQGAEVVALNQASVEQHPLVQAILKTFPGAKIGEVQDHSLDEYGLPPEITVPLTDDEPPDLEFAPLDADFLDEDDLNLNR